MYSDLLLGTGSSVKSSVADPDPNLKRTPRSAWTDANPDPGGKNPRKLQVQKVSDSLG